MMMMKTKTLIAVLAAVLASVLAATGTHPGPAAIGEDESTRRPEPEFPRERPRKPSAAGHDNAGARAT